MGFLEGFKTNLQRLQVETQSDLVLQLLQRKFDELTFGDLRQFLASPLARGLDSTRIAAILPGGAATKPSLEPSAPPKAPARPKEKQKPAGGKKRARKRTAGTQRAARGRRDIRSAVLEKLQSASTPLNNRELSVALGVDRGLIREALKALRAAGSITAYGNAPKLRFAITSGPKGAEREARSNSKKRGRKPAKSAVTGRTPAGRAAHDAAVLAALREVGEQAAISALLVKTGGTDNQLRNALHRLIAAGRVERTGERDRTRYTSLPQPPSTP